MKTISSLLILCCVFVSASSSVAAAAKQQLTFAWPIPCKVRVTQSTTRDATSVTMRYLLVAKRSAGKTFTVTIEDFAILKLNGVELSTLKGKQQAAPMLQQIAPVLEAAMIPTMIVGKDGQLVDIQGMERTIEMALAGARRTHGLKTDDPAWKTTIALLKSPQMIAQIKEKSADCWRAWVGAWVGLELAPGETLPRATAIPFPDGSKLETAIVYKHEGPLKTNPRLVRLSASSVIDGPQARARMARFMKQMMARLPQKPGGPLFDEKMLTGFRREVAFSVETNPSTLVPSRATMRALSVVEMQGQRKQRLDQHEYVFEVMKAK